MKTSAIYGFVSALAGAFLVLLQYFTGLHSDPAKLGVANAIGGIGGLAIAITCIVLGMRARRAESTGGEFNYGSAFVAGFQVTLVSTVLSAIFSYAYYAFINPAFSEVMTENALSKAQAGGMSGAQLERVEGFYHSMFSPVGALIVTLVFGMIVGTILCLLAAIFVRSNQPPKVAPV